ncbi:MAG: hypothetical protein DMG76_18140 [Acidobacteria bacterium]|nr:MAG: hypothetical protein DMG76_18140 [Acidobacteriota bacterium]
MFLADRRGIGPCFWSRLVIVVPGYLLFCIGFAMAEPELARGFAAIAGGFIVLCILAVPMNPHSIGNGNFQLRQYPSPRHRYPHWNRRKRRFVSCSYSKVRSAK